MLRSMTAFATKRCQTNWGELTWELRSVNHRYLDMTVRMPEELRPLEQEVRKIVTRWVKRGKVECSFKLRADANSMEHIAVNEDLAKSLIMAMQKISAWLDNAEAINPAEILRWPEVLRINSIDPDATKKDVLQLLQETLTEFMESRKREGQKLMQHLLERLDLLQEQVELVAVRQPHVLHELREKLLARLQEIKVDLDQNRLEQEMVMLVQKLDIDEELMRLRVHIAEGRRILNHDEPVGRRLDFLMQELNREANTLSSKSTDVATTQAGMEMKVLIEQMREQVQNTE